MSKINEAIKMKVKLLHIMYFITFLLIYNQSYSQVAIGSAQFVPNPCSMLEVQASNRGILIPRISYTNRPTSPIDGCLIYVIANGPSGNNAFYYYSAGTSSWVMLAGGNSLSGTGTNGYASYWTCSNTLGSEQYLNISRGGTGLGSTPANGQLLIGNGVNYTLANLTGTANQIIVANVAGGITLSTPQNINTVSSPTFASLTLTNPLGLSSGGTNASLTANNGGIVWSNASQLQILNGTATVNQMLMSGASSAPTWSTAVYPATTTANQLLYSSANNNITGLTTAPGGILNTSATSVPSITAAPTLGVANTIGGSLTLEGSLSGAITIQPPTTILNAYNFILPTSAGTSGQVLLSGGGGAMIWSNFSINNGHLQSQQATTPVILSSYGTCSFVGNATDVAGKISVTTTAAAGNLTVSFNISYDVDPIVIITPTDALAAADMTQVYVTSSINSFVINFGTSTQTGIHTYNYSIIETH